MHFRFTWELVLQVCIHCEENNNKLFDQRSFRGESVSNRLCLICGLVFQSPRMTEDKLETFYEREYRQLYQGSEGPNPKDLAVQRNRADSLLKFSTCWLDNIKRHLDIGCGAGKLLLCFQETYGCKSVGIEPGSAYRAYARDQGLEVYASLEHLLDSEEAHFDLISMAHVLEHIADPVGYLIALRENLMEKNGLLLLEVPNLYVHDCFEVAHLVSYSAHTFKQTLKKAGFGVIHLEQHGRPRSEILSLYLTVLARPETDPSTFQLIPESGVKLKRQLGLLRRRVLTRLYPGRAWLPINISET